jgi:acetolactate synthase-1/2/3 large subunit
MPKMRGSQFIAKTLKTYGVTHVFLVPVILRETMSELEDIGIQHIVTHSEKAAAYMADGYARMKQAPGICMAQSVGAANLAAGLQDAYLGMSPVIAITGHSPFSNLHRNTYQEISHIQPFDAITKYSVHVETPDQLPLYLRQAFRESISGTSLPVHLDLQGIRGEYIEEFDLDAEIIAEPDFTQRPSFRPEPEIDRILNVIKMISESSRPVIIAGGGVSYSKAQKELVEFAELMSIPIATSMNAKGVIDETHNLSLGVCGTYSRESANRAVAEADLVIFLGSQTGSQVTHFWQIPPQGTRVIQIDTNPSEIGRNYPGTYGVLSDVRAALRKLIELVEPISRKEWNKRTSSIADTWRNEVSELSNSKNIPILPEALCQSINKTLPPNGVVVADTGHAGIWTASMMDLDGNDQKFLRAAGSLGWGFPAALGAKCAAPERAVVCFTGDGGFWYHISELETAVRYGINTITVVNNNKALSQNRRGDEVTYSRFGKDGGSLSDFSDIDFSKVAESMGAVGFRVTDPAQLDDTINKALELNQPVVIDVVTDVEQMAPAPWIP